jgi:hypothetical protein
MIVEYPSNTSLKSDRPRCLLLSTSTLNSLADVVQGGFRVDNRAFNPRQFPGDAGELPLDRFDAQKPVHLVKVFSDYVDSPHEDLILAPDFGDSDC